MPEPSRIGLTGGLTGPSPAPHGLLPEARLLFTARLTGAPSRESTHSTWSSACFPVRPRRHPLGGVEPHAIPPVDVIDADDHRVRIEVGTPRDTVADLADALGVRAPFGLEIGGIVVAPQRPLVEVESLVEGARVAPLGGPSDSAQPPDATSTFEFAIVAGPSCRPWVPLPTGRHGVGRSPALTVHLDDPSVELHHALLVVDRSVRIVQLTGRTPIDVVTPDGSAPVVDDGDGIEIRPGDVVAIGASRVAFRVAPADAASTASNRDVHASTVGPAAGDPWHRELRRGPPPPDEAPDDPIRLPMPSPRDPFPPATALVGAGVAALGAVVLAVVLGQAMFAVIALVGALASFATWVVGVVGVARRRARARRSARAADAHFEQRLRDHHRLAGDRHRARNPDLAQLIGDALGERHLVWSRRIGRDGVRVGLGPGTLALQPVVESGDSSRPDPSATQLATVGRWSCVSGVVIPVVIAPAEAFAVAGAPHAVRGLLRSIVIQVATTLGPADVQIVVVSDDAPGWEWVSWLPHARSALGDVLVFGTDELERLADVGSMAVPLDDRRVVLIVDAPDALTVRTGPLRRFVGSDRVSTIVGCAAGAGVPNVCRRVLTIGSTGRAEWSGPRRDDDPTVDEVLVAGLGEPVARRVARALAGLADPEDVTESVAGMPATLAFSALHPEVLGRGVAGIVDAWLAGGDDPPLAVVVGASVDGVVELDLDRDGPHALIAGTTGSGKSELLRTIVVGLAAAVSPAHLQFVLVDYKGGATFDGCRTLPHTVGLVTDLEGGLAERALVSLEAELTRRERLFRDAAAADLREYRTRGRPPLLASGRDDRRIRDDGAGRAGIPAGVGRDRPARPQPRGAPRPGDAAARRGGERRHQGEHQSASRPAGQRSGRRDRCRRRRSPCHVPETAAGPVCGAARARRVGRVPGGVDGGPASHRPSHPVGPTVAANAIRSARTTRRTIGPRTACDELSAIVDSIRRAAEQTGSAADSRVWLEPLPALLEPGLVSECVASGGPGETNSRMDGPTHDAVGVIDDPAHQTRRPLRWDVAAGNLLLVGAIGSGVTSTIVSLAAAACRTSSPDDLHVYVIDGHGDRSLDGLAQIAHCGGVIRLGDGQRVDRLLRRLDAEIDRRAVERSDADPTILLLIDGIGALRRSLDTIDRLAVLALLDRILEAGPAAGITTCCSTDGTNVGAPIPAADRWIFRVDEHAAAHMGVGRGVAAERPPGRLRVMSSGLDAQVAVGADGLAELSGRAPGVGPRAIELLPAWIDPAELPASEHRSTTGRSVRRLVLGRRADDLEPASLDVPAGDHIFIGGAGRTGTSTVLAQVAAAWRSLEGERSVVEWLRRSPILVGRAGRRCHGRQPEWTAPRDRRCPSGRRHRWRDRQRS